MMTELRVLDRSGDTRVTWDHHDEASKTKARAEVARLKEAGYLFFLVDGSPADEIEGGRGELVARYVDETELFETPAIESPTPTEEAPPATEAPKKKGRPRKVIATRPVRGG
jgi:hypothetical protein